MRHLSWLVVLVASMVASTSALQMRSSSLRHRHIRRQDAGGLTPMYRTCLDPTDVLMTFDDGPSANTARLVEHLDNEQVPGTFFLNGHNANNCIYDHVAEIREAFLSGKGHVFASHGWSHKNFISLSDQEAIAELERVEMAFDRILGVQPRLFRFPFGSYDERMLGILMQRGYTGVLHWSFDAQDAVPNPITLEEQIQRYQVAAETGALGQAITLQHDTRDTTVDTLVPAAIDIIRGAGLNIVNVETCLGIEPYSVIRKPAEWATPDDTWTCSDPWT